jgi:hypothetical protein
VRGKHLREIVHFGDKQIFEDAITYTCILSLTKNPRESFTFTQVVDLIDWMEHRVGENAILALPAEDDEWTFKVGASTLLDKLLSSPTRLADVAEKIFVGVQTSADSIYILKFIEDNDTTYTVYSRAKQKQYKIERDILKPLLKGSEIRRFAVDPIENVILFPYVLAKESVKLMSQTELEGNFPLAWKYLIDCKTLLESREDGRWQVAEWWQFGRNQNIAEMPRAKILNQVLSRQASFTLDATGEYCFVGGGNAGGYGLRLKQGVNFTEYSILGILNSNVADYYIKNISTTFRGGFFSYAKRFTEKLPIPNPPADLRDRIAALARRCLDAAKSAPHTLPALEAELNGLVYQAYGLDQDDIAVIEGYLAGRLGGAPAGEEEEE